MKIAIYSRKSKLTEKGDSIENQIKLCSEYATGHFGASETDILIYEDEGFSGGNISRPKFLQMMADAKDGKFQLLICYRLDRVSRSISDFSTFIDELEKNEIGFVSLREQFDTSMPMGRAMMYISSVFAQLERETIAERIRDNMLQLAKTGRWLGGNTPTGYISAPIETTDRHGLVKKAFRLVPLEEEARLVKLLFDKYIELNSLRKLETYCVQNDITSKNNRRLSRFALSGILANPAYVRADSRVYDFFRSNGYNVYSEKKLFSGVNGVLAYNKTNESAQKARKKSEWIVAVGVHEGIVEASVWLKVQQMLAVNKDKSFRKIRNSQALLPGVLRCSKCGSPMRPKISGGNRSGKRSFSYMCELKEISKSSKCDVKNINGNALDEIVFSEIIKIPLNASFISGEIIKEALTANGKYDSMKNESNLIEEKIIKNERTIQILLSNLGEPDYSPCSQHVLERIDFIAAQNEALKKNLKDLSDKQGAFDVSSILSDFKAIAKSATVYEKRALLRAVVKIIKWDGENVSIELSGEEFSGQEIPLCDPRG